MTASRTSEGDEVVMTRLEPQGRDIPHIPLLLFLFAIAIRIPFTSKMLFHHDSVNFALALEHFDLRVHQPHPPGYFLYIVMGRFVHLFIPDANLALICLSITFTGLTVPLIYLLAKEMYDCRTAVIASLLAAVSPNLWFHGEVALSYGVEAFFSALTGFLCWKIHQGRHDLLWVAALVLGVAGGFRQNTMVFLFGLAIFAAWKAPARRIVPALILLVAVCSVWFLAMVRLTGGMEAYTAAFRELWRFNTGHNSVFEAGWQHFRLFSEALFAFNVYGLGAGLAVMGTAFYSVARSGELSSLCRGKRWFYAAWILPSYLFYQMIFIHPANPGYALIFLVPLLLLCARCTLRLGEKIEMISGRKCSALLTFAVLIANAGIFLSSETLASRGIIKRHDRDLALIVNELRSLNPEDTAIILQPSVFYGFRMIMYYLPEYTVYNAENSQAIAAGVKQTFWGTNRRTFLSERILLPANLSRVATFQFEGRGAGVRREIAGLSGVWIASGPAAAMMRDLAEVR